jgi:hypothetical protein
MFRMPVTTLTRGHARSVWARSANTGPPSPLVAQRVPYPASSSRWQATATPESAPKRNCGDQAPQRPRPWVCSFTTALPTPTRTARPAAFDQSRRRHGPGTSSLQGRADCHPPCIALHATGFDRLVTEMAGGQARRHRNNPTLEAGSARAHTTYCLSV